MNWPIILTAILALAALLCWVLLADVEDLDTTDSRGLSDAEREELGAIEHHTPGRWE